MKLSLNQKAFVMPSVIITSLFLTTMAIIITELAVSNFRIAVEDRARLNSQLATDAGLDYAIAALNNDNDWTDSSGEVELLNNGTVRTTYEVSAADGAGDGEKIVTAIGRAFEPASSTNPKHERTFITKLRGINNSGNFSIVTGVGGLYLSNSAKIVGGDVFVNGEIELSGSSQIGLTTNTVNVEVAHITCPVPPDATYPSPCTASDGEPISISNPAQTYASIRANNQVTTDHMNPPGLIATSGVTERPLPAYDRDAHKAAATASGNTLTGSAASCTNNNGSVFWPADVIITGNVSISKSCSVTMLGDAWVTGNVSVANSGQIIVSDTLTAEPDLMIDGSDGFEMRNSSALTSNSLDKGIYIRTYHSAAACSPDCADVTGVDLYNSRNEITIDLDQSASAPESVLFARWTRVEINNSGDIGALVGQTVALKNRTAVTFGTSVPTPGINEYTYVIREYRRQN